MNVFYHNETARTRIKMANKIGLKMISSTIPKIRMPNFFKITGGMSPFLMVAAAFQRSNRSLLFLRTSFVFFGFSISQK